jgi:hypothetical protein
MSTNYIIEDGMNTNYIDTLLMSLFYTPSFLENVFLNNFPKQASHIYLQELIRNRFIDNIRNSLSILSNSLNEIRNYLYISGWLTNDVIFNNQEIINFYTYINDIFNCQTIKVEQENDNKNIQYINLNIDNETTDTSIKDLYEKWLIGTDEQNNEKKIINIPPIIPFVINRFNNKIKINIQKKIKLNPFDEYNDLDFSFHSVICFSGDTLENGHYYSLLQNCGKWYIYDDKKYPCLNEVKMDEKNIINMIMSECIIIFYLYNQN